MTLRHLVGISRVCDELIERVLPHLRSVLVEQLVLENGVLCVTARTWDDGAVGCLGCGVSSRRVHSRYVRRLADVPAGGHPVMITLSVRRLFCDNDDCGKVTFAEQVEGLTFFYGRRTPLLRGALEAMGVVLAARAVVRLSLLLGATVSRSTVLRLVMALPEPDWAVPRVLGVDDFATRRGHRYGTILIDCETHQPLDLLPGRESETFAVWLREHPGIEIICRDRALCYADGARTGAPQAAHCADRWHVWHNLGEAVERLVSQHRAALRAAALESAEDDDQYQHAGQADDEVQRQVPEGRFTSRARDTHARVQAEAAHGHSLREIARRLHMTRKTVTKYARAATPESLFHSQWQNRATILDPFKPYLYQRWSEGCTQANRLYQEIKERGFKGSYSTVCLFLLPLREGGRPPALLPPSPRRATRWIMSHPDHLEEDTGQYLKRLLEVSPELASATAHVRAFAALMANRDGVRLPEWIAAVRADPACGLRTFVNGLDTDLDAVVNGLSTQWSSGPVEGRVNDLKALKRAMFGRAGLPLLRKRLLLIAASRQPLTVTGTAAP